MKISKFQKIHKLSKLNFRILKNQLIFKTAEKAKYTAELINSIKKNKNINYEKLLIGKKQNGKELSFFKKAFNTSISADSFANRKGIIISANKSFIKVWGYSNIKEVIGKPIPSFFKNKKDAIKIINILNKVGYWEGDWQAKKKNGSFFNAHTIATVIKDDKGKIVGYQSSVTDITEKVRIQEEMIRSNKRLEEAQKTAHIGDYVLNIKTGLWTSSKELDNIFGINNKYTRSIKGWENLIHPEDRKMMSDYFANEVLGQHKSFDKEYRIINKKNKNIIWIHGMGQLKFDNSKKPIEMAGAIQDISEYKNQEENFKTLFDENPLPTILSELPSGKIVFVNKQMLKAIGLTSSEVIGKTANDLGLLKGSSLNNLTRLVSQKGKIDGMEINRTLPDGSFSSDLISMRLIKINNRYHVLTISNNINDRKKIENDLRTRESYLTSVIENQPGLIWLKNSNGIFLTTNTAFALSAGKKTPEDIIGKNDYDIWPKNLASKYVSDDKKVIKSNKALKTEELINDKGVNKWFETYKMPISIGKNNVIGTTGFALDITDRKADEQKLIESKQKFFNLFENAGDAIWVLDGNVFIDCNNYAYKILGYKNKKDIIGHTPFDFSPIKQPNGKDSKKESTKYIRTTLNGNPQRFEWELLKKDGTSMQIEMSLSVIKTGEKKFIQAIGRDISERKQLDEAKSNFLSIASHQLRTPLSMTKWVLEALLEQGSLNPKQQNKLNELVYSNERLIHLVNDLLKVSVIDTGKLQINKKPTDISLLINRLISSIGILLKNKSKNINTFGFEGLEKIYCDPLLVYEVIENLLINAIDYSSIDSREITVRIINRSDDYLISVNNAGVMDKSTKEKISKFDKFVRGSSASEVHPSGSGLGLYITQKVVKACGGDFWFESNNKSGTTFYFTIIKK